MKFSKYSAVARNLEIKRSAGLFGPAGGDPTKQSLYTTRLDIAPLLARGVIRETSKIHIHGCARMYTLVYTYVPVSIPSRRVDGRARLCITSIKAICTREGTRARWRGQVCRYLTLIRSAWNLHLHKTAPCERATQSGRSDEGSDRY